MPIHELPKKLPNRSLSYLVALHVLHVKRQILLKVTIFEHPGRLDALHLNNGSKVLVQSQPSHFKPVCEQTGHKPGDRIHKDVGTVSLKPAV